MKKGIQYLLIIPAFLLLAFAPTNLRAQGNNKSQPTAPPRDANTGKGNIKSLKIAFITNRLALTTTEAQGFWPIYNEKQQKQQDLAKQRRELMKQARDGYYSMPDADMEKNIKQIFAVQQQELDLEKHYYDAFKAVLPVKKIALLYKVEKDFKKEVLKQALTRAEEE